MTRATRSFRLTLSSTGMDLLIDAHCHIIRATRSLLSWGASLHIAIVYLDTVSSERVAAAVRHVQEADLIGAEDHFLGAPVRLADIAGGIADRACGAMLDAPYSPLLGEIYIVALQAALQASPAVLRDVHQRIRAEASLQNSISDNAKF